MEDKIAFNWKVFSTSLAIPTATDSLSVAFYPPDKCNTTKINCWSPRSSRTVRKKKRVQIIKENLSSEL